MEALLENYASSSDDDDDEARTATAMRQNNSINNNNNKRLPIDPAPKVNVANLALTKVAMGVEAGGSSSAAVVVVVPKSDVANANEEFLQPNAQVLKTNLTYEQMSAKVEGPEHPNLKRRDERRARNHHMGFVQTLNVDSFAFDAQYNTHLQTQQERQREEQTRRGDGRKVSGKSATTTTTSVCVRAHRQVFFWLFFATVLLLGFQKKIFWSFGGEKKSVSVF